MRKKAFTLAEILITLGVIGVVSALTIPMLIDRWQYARDSESLKVAYSTLSQGFQKMMADSEVNDMTATTIWFDQLGKNFDDSAQDARQFKSYFNTLVAVPYERQVQEGWPDGGKTFTGEKCTKFVGMGSAWYKRNRKECIGLRQQVYRLNNGTLIRMGFFNSYPEINEPSCKIKKIVAEITIDVNGPAKPNVFGEDAFEFFVDQNGILHPIFGLEYAKYVAAVYGKDYKDYYWYGIDDGADRCRTGNGRACAAAIMEMGWKINYTQITNPPQ